MAAEHERFDGMEQGFLVRVEDRGDREVVHVHGELDMARAPELASAFAQLNGYANDVLVNLTDCTFLDSGGIHAIMRGRAMRPMRIVCRPGHVRRVLDIVAVGRLFPLHDTLDDALAT